MKVLHARLEVLSFSHSYGNCMDEALPKSGMTPQAFMQQFQIILKYRGKGKKERTAQRYDEVKAPRSGDKRVMGASEKEVGVSAPKKNHVASCSQGVPCKIPPSYEISSETLETVKRVMNEDVSDTVAGLKALADPMRVRILKALRVADLCVCVLVELMACEYSRLSYHLRVLKEAGLIECTQDGTFLIYRLTELGAEKVKVL